MCWIECGIRLELLYFIAMWNCGTHDWGTALELVIVSVLAHRSGSSAHIHIFYVLYDLCWLLCWRPWGISPLSLFCLWPFCCAQFSGHISCAFDGLVNVGRAHKLTNTWEYTHTGKQSTLICAHIHTHTHTGICTHVKARRHYTLINCSDCTSIAFSLPFRFLCLLLPLLPLLLLHFACVPS